jgi:hypothetical protein
MGALAHTTEDRSHLALGKYVWGQSARIRCWAETRGREIAVKCGSGGFAIQNKTANSYLIEITRLGREPINSEWSADVRFGAHSGLKSDIA